MNSVSLAGTAYPKWVGHDQKAGEWRFVLRVTNDGATKIEVEVVNPLLSEVRCQLSQGRKVRLLGRLWNDPTSRMVKVVGEWMEWGPRFRPSVRPALRPPRRCFPAVGQ